MTIDHLPHEEPWNAIPLDKLDPVQPTVTDNIGSLRYHKLPQSGGFEIEITWLPGYEPVLPPWSSECPGCDCDTALTGSTEPKTITSDGISRLFRNASPAWSSWRCEKCKVGYIDNPTFLAAQLAFIYILRQTIEELTETINRIPQLEDHL